MPGSTCQVAEWQSVNSGFYSPRTPTRALEALSHASSCKHRTRSSRRRTAVMTSISRPIPAGSDQHDAEFMPGHLESSLSTA
jgi:hypothetical protein